MSETNALVPCGAAEPDMLFDAQSFRHAMDLAKTISQSALIPAHLRGQVPDILLALYMAKTMRENPLIVLQSIYVVSGRAGWSAQYLIGRANASGRFRGPIRWREAGEGETLALTAYATLAETGEDVEFTVDMAMAHAEGWTRRNPKYRTMPGLMLRYRSATLLVRLFCPDVLMGLHERYELIDSDKEQPPFEAPASPAPRRLQAMPPALPESSSASPSSRLASPPADAARETAALEADDLSASPSITEEPKGLPGGGPSPSVMDGSAESSVEPAKDEQRAAAMAELNKLREDHPNLVRDEARKMGLSSPGRSSVARIEYLCAQVRSRIIVAAGGEAPAPAAPPPEEPVAEEPAASAPQAAAEPAAVPEVFPNSETAISWGMERGVFETVEEARLAYEMVKKEGQPANAYEMAEMWVAEVNSRARPDPDEAAEPAPLQAPALFRSAELELDRPDLLAAVRSALAEVEANRGPDAVREAGEAAGLPIDRKTKAPTTDGAPDPMVRRFLQELNDRITL